MRDNQKGMTLVGLLFWIVVLGVILVATTVPRAKKSSTPDPNFTDLVQTSLKGVVYIEAPGWHGSGFVAGPRLIITAGHIVEDVEDFLITIHDNHQIRATRAISDKDHDLALIRIDDLTCTAKDCELAVETDNSRFNIKLSSHQVVLTPLPLGSIKDCVLGQNVYVIGSPYGKMNFNSLTTGSISGVNRDWSPLGENYGWNVAFTVDSAGHPGNSGCPVFTTDGVVRGILVGGFSPVLISVMPCDLFLGELESIRLMFLMDRYEREETADYDGYEGYDERRDRWGLEK